MPDTQLTAAERRAVIDKLYEDYAEIDVLAPLARSGRRLVKGHGLVTAPLMIVGEAPGEDEERSGEPFTGPAGQLLRRLLKDAGIPWEMCYVTNTLPWRPTHNRTPYPFEIQASMRRVQGEVIVIGPRVVIAAGAVAFQALSGKQHGPFPAARAKWMPLHPLRLPDSGIMMLTIYHPSYLLQLPANRRGPAEDETRAALASVLTGERVAI